MLQCLREQTLTGKFDRITLKVHTGHSGFRITHPLEIETGDGKATFVHEFRFAGDFNKNRVQDVTNRAVDVVAEGTKVHPDLGSRNASTPREFYRVKQIVDETLRRGITQRNRR